MQQETKQKIQSIFKTSSFIIIIVFSLFGCQFFSTILHEYSHAQDFKGIAKDGKICALVLPENISSIDLFKLESGYYSFNILKNDTMEYDRISTYTEYKAYSIDALIIIIWLIFAFILWGFLFL